MQASESIWAGWAEEDWCRRGPNKRIHRSTSRRGGCVSLMNIYFMVTFVGLRSPKRICLPPAWPGAGRDTSTVITVVVGKGWQADGCVHG